MRHDRFAGRGGWWVFGQGVLLAAVAVALPWGVPAPLWVAILGGVVVAWGGVLAWAGAIGLGVGLTPYPEPFVDSELVDTGVYGWVRHPIYGGLGLLAIGAALLARSPLSLGVGVLLLIYLAAKSASEERRLLDRHPDYAEYRRRVPRRLVPWVW